MAAVPRIAHWDWKYFYYVEFASIVVGLPQGDEIVSFIQTELMTKCKEWGFITSIKTAEGGQATKPRG